jgi:hypothetical protein
MEPTGLEAYHELKELRPVFGHKLNRAWKDLGPKVCDLLDSQGVPWTTIDVVRFIKVGEGEVVGPVVLWIGVAPETLSGKDAHTSASGCLELLKEFGITDVEVEYRESTYTQSTGPELLELVPGSHPTAKICNPLTPVLGLSISAQATPYAGGTGGLYLVDNKKVLLVTARHVLCPPDEGPNINFTHTDTSACCHDILLLGTKAFENLIETIEVEIRVQGQVVNEYNEQVQMLQVRKAGEDQDNIGKVMEKLEETQKSLDKEKGKKEALEKIHNKVKKEWSQPSQRVLGHTIRSPPIAFGVGAKQFTEDYAIVELDSSKIEKAFKGNVIDLGAF